MSFLINSMMRTTVCPCSTRLLMQTTVQKRFSGILSSGANSFIGPAPSQPALPGEIGHDVFINNMKFSHKLDQGSILSHADIQKIKPSSREHSIFTHLINELTVQNAELKKLNKNIVDLITIVTLKKQ